MWARRIGLPPLWPSRLKVLIVGAISWWTVSQIARILQSASVNFLNLDEARNDMDMSCWKVLPECQNNATKWSALQCLVNQSNPWYHKDHSDILVDECDVDLSVAREVGMRHWQKCTDLNLPINYGQTEQGKLHTLTRKVNPFKLWGTLFLVFASLLILAVVFHDLVLLSKMNRPKILSLLSMKQEFPRLWRAQQCLRISKRMHDMRRNDTAKYVLLFLPHLVWQLAVFVFVIYPVCVICCIIFPMRFCRLGVFMSGTNMILWSLVLMGEIYRWMEQEHWAVFFDAKDIWRHEPELSLQEVNSRCVCYCEHPIKGEIFQQLLMLAVLMLIQSFGLTFRSLKGLRQARWACLFTVTYVVPIEVFPVMWTKPDGEPIQHRKKDEEVQGEPAFDPFALMDEQPESWRSTIDLKPLLLTPSEAITSEWNTHAKNTMDRELRCCGFPKFHRIDRDSSSEGSDGESEESESETQVKATRRAASRTRAAPARQMEVQVEEQPPDAEDWRSDKLGKWRTHQDED